MKRLASLILASGFAFAAPHPVLADITVAASIKPVHSLVAAVMQGTGEPGLIVEGAGSPHTYALKPSQARLLQEADLVFWVGPTLEAFLEKPLETIAAKAEAVELFDVAGLVHLPYREGTTFERHKHDADEPDNEHDHAAEGHDHAAEGHGHEDEGHGQAEHGVDGHVWLDPVNAKALVDEIAARLAAADPRNAATYRANAASTRQRLDALIGDVQAKIDPVRDRPFIVFHDAYQYFENRFGLQAAGSVTLSPEHAPGAERIAAIRAKIGQLSAACVFSEPQFEPKLIQTVIEGTPARSGVIDPLGASLPAGPDLYFALIGNMAKALHDCLAGES